MPERYHITTRPVAGHFRRIGKLGSVDWREDCSRCASCVKTRCVFDTYRKESAHNRNPLAAVQTLYECRGCLSCVQGCTKGLLAIATNPEYLEMGDETWRPDILATTWAQADTGRIPVSGAGYRGLFRGPGFDSIWTDMSEIVRPTRDGIHGREYISTAVDIGGKPMRLRFSPDGRLLTEPANLVEIPIPVLLDVPPWSIGGPTLARARAQAAVALKTLAVVEAQHLAVIPEAERPSVVPLCDESSFPAVQGELGTVRMIEIADGPQATAIAARASATRASIIPVLRVKLGPGCTTAVLAAARAGINVFHVCADRHGREQGVASPRHIRDGLRELHGTLVKEGMRDEVTVIVGGGIALAEHMAKAIICGADAVAADLALVVALGCQVCAAEAGGCQDTHCPAEIAEADADYAAQRMVNLMGAWHSQLIEVLGAMGIREVRRLRGEVGRAVFADEIEREAFGDLARG